MLQMTNTALTKEAVEALVDVRHAIREDWALLVEQKDSLDALTRANAMYDAIRIIERYIFDNDPNGYIWDALGKYLKEEEADHDKI